MLATVLERQYYTVSNGMWILIHLLTIPKKDY